MSLDRATLLAALKTKTQTADIAGIGQVQVTELSLTEMDELRALVKTDAQDNAFGLFVAIRSIRDDAGAPIFTDADLAELRSDSNVGVQAMIATALTVNGLIQVEAKNSAPSVASASA